MTTTPKIGDPVLYYHRHATHNTKHDEIFGPFAAIVVFSGANGLVNIVSWDRNGEQHRHSVLQWLEKWRDTDAVTEWCTTAHRGGG